VITTPNDSTDPHSGGMTRAELLALPVTVDVGTAARALGLGRSTGYELARRGEFLAACFASAAPTTSRPPTSSASSISAPWSPNRANRARCHPQRDTPPADAVYEQFKDIQHTLSLMQNSVA
jgi:hypothetical protein